MTSQLRADPSETATRSIQRWVLVCSILASSMAFIDGTALSVVMPALQVSLNATGAGMLWVINGFSLPLAALLLLGGGLGDCFGRKRMFVLGIISFAAASVACGLAGGMPTLIAARVVQGMGGALMIPGSLAMLSTCFSAEERGKAIGTWSAFSVLASAIGPVLGGLLARAGMWRWVFYINLPLAGIVLAVLWLKTPADRKPDHPPQVDWRGALAAAVGLASLNFGLIQWPRIGLAHFGVIAALVTGVASLMLFVFIERRATLPLLPLGVFKSRTLQGASVLSVLFFMAFHGMLFFLPLNLIQVQGYDPAMAGLTQLPLMSMLILLSRWAGKLVDRRGPRLPLTVGPSVAGFGFLFFAGPGVTAGPHEFWFSFLPGLLLVGVGLGLTAAPLSTTVMSSVSDEKLGLASGINSSLTRLAGVLAIAVMGAVMLASFDHFLEIRAARLELPTEASVQLQREAPKLAEAQVPPGLSPLAGAAVKQTIREAFVDAFRVVAILAAGLSWLGALVAARLLNAHTPSPPSQNGDGVSERFVTGAGNPDESAPPVKRASE